MTAETRARGEWLLGESLVGATSGWLTVVEPAERPIGANVKIRGTWWLCRCRCGKEKVYPRQYIVQQNVKSCGCKGPGRPQGEKNAKQKNATLYIAKCKWCKAPVETPRSDYGWYIGDKRFCSYKHMRLWETANKTK